jgi:hypothetical protein
MTGNDNEPDPIPPPPRSRENGHIPSAFYPPALRDAPVIDLEAEDGPLDPSRASGRAGTNAVRQQARGRLADGAGLKPCSYCVAGLRQGGFGDVGEDDFAVLCRDLGVAGKHQCHFPP